MPSLKRSRQHEATPELELDLDLETPVTKHSKTGRPLRASAGKRGLPLGYVNTDAAIDSAESSNTESDFDSTDEEKHKARPKKQKESLREARELSEDPGDHFDMVKEDSNIDTPSMIPHEVSLTFNAPPGHTGPFVVKLDIASLISASTARLDSLYTPSMSSRSSLKPATSRNIGHAIVNTTPVSQWSSADSSDLVVSHSSHGKTGFLDLAPELRNVIYRLALVRESVISFPHAKCFRPLPAALLATCRQIQIESSQILYGENRFRFSRNHRVRGRYYESDWKEVGWKDIRTLLQMIGPSNIANMREVFLDVHDGVSHANDEDELHRCVNDDHLAVSLQLLAEYGQLRKLHVSLRPRKAIIRDDRRFLKSLQGITADEVTFDGERSWYPRWRRYYWNSVSDERANPPLTRMSSQLEKSCLTKMKRSPKLYWCEDPKSAGKQKSSSKSRSGTKNDDSTSG